MDIKKVSRTTLSLSFIFLALSGSTLSAEETNEKVNINISDTVDNAELFAIVPKEESIVDEDVCIYVTSNGSDTYRDLVNEERATWGLDSVALNDNLNTGSMLRAGENAELWLSGQQDSKLSHDTQEYEIIQENLALTAKDDDPANAFNMYMREKKYLPDDYNPNDGGSVDGAGHYENMMDPTVKYVGQGIAYADYQCDGGEGGYYSYTYANEFEDYTNESSFPDLQGEIDKNLARFDITYADQEEDATINTNDDDTTTSSQSDENSTTSNQSNETSINTTTSTEDSGSVETTTSAEGTLVDTSKNYSTVILSLVGIATFGGVFFLKRMLNRN